MRRHLLHVLIIIALVLQGAVVVASALPTPSDQQHHCASHDAQGEHCPCCADGGTAATCTVQCSVAHTASLIYLPFRFDTQDVSFFLADQSVDDPAYVPPVPPPIF